VAHGHLFCLVLLIVETGFGAGEMSRLGKEWSLESGSGPRFRLKARTSQCTRGGVVTALGLVHGVRVRCPTSRCYCCESLVDLAWQRVFGAGVLLSPRSYCCCVAVATGPAHIIKVGFGGGLRSFWGTSNNHADITLSSPSRYR
jgi:hypothetical protein